MQKVLIVFALLAISAFASIPINTEEIKSLWSSWKIYYGKAYTAAEESARLAIFTENYKKVILHNAANEDLKFAMNKFADLTSTEFKTIHRQWLYSRRTTVSPPLNSTKSKLSQPLLTGEARVPSPRSRIKANAAHAGLSPPPVSWKDGTKSPRATLLSFSEQQIVDCDKNDDGCDGGDPVEALTYTADQRSSNSSSPTHTLLKMAPASSRRLLLSTPTVAQTSSLPRTPMPSRLPWLPPQSLSPSKPMKTSSNSTALVSSRADAVIAWITLFWLSATPLLVATKLSL